MSSENVQSFLISAPNPVATSTLFCNTWANNGRVSTLSFDQCPRTGRQSYCSYSQASEDSRTHCSGSELFVFRLSQTGPIDETRRGTVFYLW